MKKMIISLSLILLAITAFSQETGKGLIGISPGPSIPLSDYADIDGDNFRNKLHHSHINLKVIKNKKPTPG
ncbi:hypothetical protein ACFLSA_01830 [Bacteroidota bacterium]